MSPKPNAVLIGLDSITGLQTARILAGRGVDVIAIAGDRRNFCCRTRVCERIIDADIEGDGLIESLASLGQTLEEKAVLFPCTDASVLLISRHRRELEPSYHVVLPEPETVEMLMHKVSFFTYAQRAGLAIPPTVVVAGRSDAERAAETLRFPVIVKPSLKAQHPKWLSHLDVKAAKLSTPGELLSLYDRVGGETEAEALIAQQWIESGDASLFSCNCYFGRDSKPLVTFVARKLRQWPPRVGTSSLGEECRNDVVLEEALRLFEGVGFRGLGYLEMKRDATGDHFIIEPNIGRPTGKFGDSRGRGRRARVHGVLRRGRPAAANEPRAALHGSEVGGPGARFRVRALLLASWGAHAERVAPVLERLQGARSALLVGPWSLLERRVAVGGQGAARDGGPRQTGGSDAARGQITASIAS